MGVILGNLLATRLILFNLSPGGGPISVSTAFLSG
jgi:hypothetical protein